MIRFRCSKCNHRIGAPEDYAGKPARCPSCKELTFVPPPVDEVEAALAAAHGLPEEPEQPPAIPTDPTDPLPPQPSVPTQTIASPEAEHDHAPVPTPMPTPMPTPTPPPSPRVGGPTPSGSTRTVKPHGYRWLKYLASIFIALGGVATLFCLIWIILQLSESMSAQAQGRIYTRSEIFDACVKVVFMIVATTSLFAIGQALLAFRDLVENSWVTREVAARQRPTPRP